MSDIYWLILVVIYFVPTVVASKRKHHNAQAIGILNMFLGWTFIGWVAALVWATTNSSNVLQNNNGASK